jgi:wobble nucleotide-excising tRNase
MIKNIIIKNTASYDSAVGISFIPTLINFIYGSNGSGKTTISNVIANCSTFANCKLDWGLEIPLQTLVYNRTFIEENFEQFAELKGIFTLGKESKSEVENIKTKQGEIEIREKIILDCKGTLEQETTKLQKTENNFIEKCWTVLKKHEDTFIKAFEGSRGSKVRFKEKVVTESISNTQPIIAYSELESKANSILNADAVRAPEVREFIVPDFKTLEDNPVFQARIIGKSDVDIATMIMKLNNSDWIRQGISYFKANDEYCPFCQQTTTENFRKQLDEYFDESYSEQIQALKTANEKYTLECETLLSTLSNYITLNNQFIDLPSLIALKELISFTHKKNILSLEKKAKEPTLKIELDSIMEHINKVKEIISQSIPKTKAHNKIIDNI